MRGYGAIGSASDSRSGGWEFDSLWPHSFILTKIIELSNELNTLGLSKQISLKNVKFFAKKSFIVSDNYIRNCFSYLQLNTLN